MSNAPVPPKPKKRRRGCKFEANAHGKVWVFAWDPVKMMLTGWEKHTRKKKEISAEELADAVVGQFSLFGKRPEAAPEKTP